MLEKDMLEKSESVELVAADEVQKYFPKNFSDLFELGSNLSFFGLKYNSVHKKEKVPVAKARSLYLVATYDACLEHPRILDSCDLGQSGSHWIVLENSTFLGHVKKYPELHYRNPLLILWLTSHLIREDKDFVFTELMRYADHEQLRGRGIATQVFESVCEQCRTNGLKYVYVDDQSTGWPSRSKLIGVRRLPKPMFDEICDTYYDRPREEVFNVPMSRNLVRVLDDAENERLYQQMLKQIQEARSRRVNP